MTHQLDIVTIEHTHHNATDEVLIRDVKAMLQEKNIRHIWLVSGDGGYASLVRMLQQQHVDILIFGPPATSKALRKTGAPFRLI